MSTVTGYSSQVSSQPIDVDDNHKEAANGIKLVDTNPHNLKIGSVIEYGEPPQCGVIKWIGNLSNETVTYAGLEMVRLGMDALLTVIIAEYVF